MSEIVTKEEHPLPAIMMHWVHLLSFFVLIVTGILIHQPRATIPMDTVRTTHFIAMFIFVATFIVRVYWAMFGAGSSNVGSHIKVSDWRHFLPEPANRGTLWPTIKYYIFLRKTRPYTAKYNPLQKMTYTLLFPGGIIVMAITGFALYTPTVSYMAWFANLVGGAETVRSIHYFTMWIMVVFFMIHFYLVVFEDVKEAGAMMFGTGEKAAEMNTREAA